MFGKCVTCDCPVESTWSVWEKPVWPERAESGHWGIFFFLNGAAVDNIIFITSDNFRKTATADLTKCLPSPSQHLLHVRRAMFSQLLFCIKSVSSQSGSIRHPRWPLTLGPPLNQNELLAKKNKSHLQESASAFAFSIFSGCLRLMLWFALWLTKYIYFWQYTKPMSHTAIARQA